MRIYFDCQFSRQYRRSSDAFEKLFSDGGVSLLVTKFQNNISEQSSCKVTHGLVAILTFQAKYHVFNPSRIVRVLYEASARALKQDQ